MKYTAQNTVWVQHILFIKTMSRMNFNLLYNNRILQIHIGHFMYIASTFKRVSFNLPMNSEFLILKYFTDNMRFHTIPIWESITVISGCIVDCWCNCHSQIIQWYKHEKWIASRLNKNQIAPIDAVDYFAINIV